MAPIVWHTTGAYGTYRLTCNDEGLKHSKWLCPLYSHRTIKHYHIQPCPSSVKCHPQIVMTSQFGQASLVEGQGRHTRDTPQISSSSYSQTKCMVSWADSGQEAGLATTSIVPIYVPQPCSIWYGIANKNRLDERRSARKRCYPPVLDEHASVSCSRVP